ncbi:hypothetical protein [Chryseolinea soli]|uniref:Uncharacterized protein n=1 Tax=Chryseolinea soli TaxID=2321403 RepID=A0A385SJY2_9BACT|nr:hypothetical protein [Chryseolinea soli]AYB29318.1 hypothetical protein D4L85_01400 [Chryseolinea soli]
MNEFLRKIGLIDSFQIELPMDKSDFVETLIVNLDEPGPGFFEAFSTNNKAYKGTVKNDGFEMRQKRKLTARATSLSIRGKFQQVGKNLIAEVTLNGFHWLMIPYYIILLIVYFFAFGFFFFASAAEEFRMIGLLFLSVHAALMLVVPYFRIRRGMRKTKYDLERDLHFMMKDKFTSGN